MRATGLLLLLLLYTPAWSQSYSWDWVSRDGSGDEDIINDVAFDTVNNVLYAGGYFSGGLSLLGLSLLGGDEDAILIRYSPTGNVAWTQSFGASGIDKITSVATDHNGNVYVAGIFHGSISFGLLSPHNLNAGLFNTSSDAFLICFNSSGVVQWARHGAGNADVEKPVVTVNHTGVYVSGNFKSAITFDGHSALSATGGWDNFLVKYSFNGNPHFATRFASADDSYVYDIAADSNHVYVTGMYEGSSINVYNPGNPAVITSLSNTNSGKTDAFVLAYNQSTGNYSWIKRIGSNDDDEGRGIAASGGKVFFSGYCDTGVSFDGTTVSGTFQGRDIYLAAADASNGSIIWANVIPDNNNNEASGEGVAVAGNKIILGGYFTQTINFPGASHSSSGGTDLFIAQFDTAGNYKWSKKAGNNNDDELRAVALNLNDEIYAGGYVQQSVTFDAINTTGTNSEDLITGKINCTSPQLSLTVQDSICAGDSALFAFNFTGQAPWDVTISTNFGQITQTIPVNTHNTYLTFPLNISYSIIAAADAFGCSVTQTDLPPPGTVTVIPPINSNSISASTTICSGSAPTALTGTTPSGGTGSYQYLWEENSGSGWTAATGTSNLSAYSPGILTDTVLYRRIVTSGACQHISDTVTITVLPPVTSNTVASSQTICSGAAPSIFTGSTPTGGNSTYTYFWEESTDSISWNPAQGVNSTKDYQAGTLTQTTWFRRRVSSGSCSGPSANTGVPVKITVLPPITANQIDSSQIICSGQAPVPLNGSAPGGGSGSYVYQWQQSTNLTTWTNATGTAGGISYSPPPLTLTTHYRRQVVSGPCAGGFGSTSDTITITVLPPVTNNIISSGQTICAGEIPAMLSGTSPAGGNGTYTYLWEMSTDSLSWATASGTSTGSNYTPGAVGTTTWYRRSVFSGPCSGTQASVSVPVKITVHPAIVFNNILSGQILCAGDQPAILSGSTPGGSTGAYGYLWQSSTDSIAWTTAGGINNQQSYQPSPLLQTTWFRRIVTSGACSDTSTTVKLSIDPVISVNTINASQTVCTGQSPAQLSGSLPTGGNGIYTYLWESFSGSWNAASGTNNQQNYLPPAPASTVQYRRSVISGACSSISDTVTITLLPPITSNTIGSSQTICAGAAPGLLTGSTPAGGNETYSLQWESSTDSITWASASGVSGGQDYQPVALSQTTWFRRVVTSGVCAGNEASESIPVKITVEPSLSNNTISSSQTICAGTVAGNLNGSQPSGGSGIYTYQWQESYDLITWVSAGGTSTGINYSPGLLTDTVYYRRQVSSGACAGAFGSVSDTVTITVTPQVSNNTISAAQTICENDVPATLTGTAASGGNGSYTYQWLQSNDNISWLPVSGSGSQLNYAPPALTDTTWYRRVVSSGVCSSTSASTSNTVQIIVIPAPSNNIISSSQQLCEGEVPAMLTGTLPSGGNGTFSYLWEESTDSIAWVTASGTATQQDYQPSSLSTTSWYRRTVNSGVCSGNFSNVSIPVKLSVDPAITSNSIGSSQVICITTLPALITGSVPAGGNGNYTYQWEMSTDSLSWTTASGSAAGQDYQPSGNNQDYYFRRIVSSGACTGNFAHVSNSVSIELFDSLSSNQITAPQTAYCHGSQGPWLTGSQPAGGDGNYSYVWETASTSLIFGTAAGNSSLDSYLVQAVTDTIYFRRIVSSGCTDTLISDTVMLYPILPTGVNFDVTNSICAGDSAILSIQLTGDAPFLLSWTENGDTVNQQINTTTYSSSFFPLINTSFVLLQVTDSNNCISTPGDTVELIVKNPPHADAGLDTSICGLEYSLTTPSGGGWIIPGMLTLTGDQLVAQQPGNYTLILEISDGFCTGTDSTVVHFVSPPLSVDAGPDQLLYGVTQTTMSAGMPAQDYTGWWSVVSGHVSISDTTDPFALVTELSPGEIVLRWHLSNDVCGLTSDDVRITIRSLMIPNGFSPNDDGINDRFVIDSPLDEPVAVNVFNRWGQEVYANPKYDNTWSGTGREGKLLPEDTYFYRVVFREEVYEGYVVIKR